MTLRFITSSGTIAIIGTLLPVHPVDLRFYVRNYPLAWVVA